MRIPAAAAAALLLMGCEVYAVPAPEPCPGDRQGTFDFSGTQVVNPTDCFFAQPTTTTGAANPAYQVLSSFGFPGTVNFGPGASDAAVCITVPHAMPRLGTHAGASLDVAYTNYTGSVGACTCPTQEAATAGRCVCPPNTPLQNCSCPVFVTERIVGDLAPIPGGYSGFDGQQIVSVRPAVTVPGTPCDCQVACTYAYTLTAAVTGAR